MAKKYTADTFEGAVTGSASLNVLKAGDTMTGQLRIDKSGTQFQVDNSGDKFLEVNNFTTKIGDIDGVADESYVQMDGNNSEFILFQGQYQRIVLDANSNIQMFGQGTNNSSGAELRILKGQQDEVTGKLKLNSTTQYLDLEYEDPGATNSFRLYRDYGYISNPIRIGANAAANELDDYEEGSYNVQFRVLSTNYGSSNWVSGGGTVWTDNSQYIKVGRKVTLFFDLQYRGIPSAISTYTGDLYLTNLPFTMAHGGGGNISFSWYNRNNSSSANPQNLGGATRLTPDGTNQSTQINLEHIEYSSYWNAWFPSSMATNYLPTQPPGGNIYMHGQFTYFTDN